MKNSSKAMKNTLWIVLIGAASIVLYDAIGALASLSLGFDYGWLVLGSTAIYVMVGYFAGNKKNVVVGSLAGAVMGLVDSTLGWYISWTVGPGKPEIDMDGTMIIATIITVTLLAAFIGMIGGFIARAIKTTA